MKQGQPLLKVDLAFVKMHHLSLHQLYLRIYNKGQVELKKMEMLRRAKTLLLTFSMTQNVYNYNR